MATNNNCIEVEVKDAIAEVRKLSKELKKNQQEFKNTDKSTSETNKGFSKLKIGVLALGAAIIGGVVASIKIGAEFETLRATLKSVTGSTEEAGVAFEFIQDVAKGMPNSLQEVTTAYTKLKALGIAPTRESLESFANTAAATGKTLDQFVEAVADSVTGEFERLKEFGIKVKNEGDTLKVNFQGVTTSIGNNSNEIRRYLTSIGKTQFAGAATDQMDTLSGKWINFKDELSKLGDEFANSAGGMSVLKTALGALTSAVGWLRANMEDMLSFIGGVWTDNWKAVVELFNDSGIAATQFGQTSGSIIGFIGDSFVRLFTDTRRLGVDFVDGIAQGFLLLKETWNVFAAAMDFAWDKVMVSVSNTWHGFLNDFKETYNATFANLPGVDALIVDLAAASQTTEGWATRFFKVKVAAAQELAVHKQSIALWKEDIALQNKNKVAERERLVLAKQRRIEQHDLNLVRDQEVNDKRVAQEAAEQKQAKASAEALKNLNKEVLSLTESYRPYETGLAKIKKTQIDLNAALKDGSITTEEYNNAIGGLAIKEGELNQQRLDRSTTWLDGTKRAFNSYVASAYDAATTAERFFNNSVAGMEDTFIEMTKTGRLEWKSFLGDLIEDLQRAELRKFFAGIFGGGSTSGGGTFAGLFANGGQIPAGQFGVVGEAGPELIGGPAQVTPLSGAGGVTYITNNYISAVDTQSFEQALGRNPRYIYTLAQDGQRGLPIR